MEKKKKQIFAVEWDLFDLAREVDSRQRRGWQPVGNAEFRQDPEIGPCYAQLLIKNDEPTGVLCDRCGQETVEQPKPRHYVCDTETYGDGGQFEEIFVRFETEQGRTAILCDNCIRSLLFHERRLPDYKEGCLVRSVYRGGRDGQIIKSDTKDLEMEDLETEEH